jgi:hypothetical protein
MDAHSGNGTRTKTALTEIGPVEIDVPRDVDASFSPIIVPKRRRRLSGIDEIVLSMTAKRPTTGENAAHFHDVYGAGGSFPAPVVSPHLDHPSSSSAVSRFRTQPVLPAQSCEEDASARSASLCLSPCPAAYAAVPRSGCRRGAP